MENSESTWYKKWFDTDYYHQLYSHRDEEEARIFISTMVMYLEIHPGQRVMDLACGKGRHSLELEGHGLEVVGFDLSPKSIEAAKIYESETVAFDVHDMRKPFTKFGKFDVIFNLFTSFGYFDKAEDDQKTIQNVFKALTPEGYLVQDYINAEAVLGELPSKGEKEFDYTQFTWTKSLQNGHIIKDIEINDDGVSSKFQERVKAYSLEEIKRLHEQAGLTIKDIFGSYELDPYHKEESPRIIVISRKA